MIYFSVTGTDDWQQATALLVSSLHLGDSRTVEARVDALHLRHSTVGDGVPHGEGGTSDHRLSGIVLPAPLVPFDTSGRNPVVNQKIPRQRLQEIDGWIATAPISNPWQTLSSAESSPNGWVENGRRSRT